jgi:hypothetical protein
MLNINMLLSIDKETLSTFAEIFEISTPVTLLGWFLHSRHEEAKRAYYKEIVGQYGGFVNETINKPIKGKRFDGGVTMEIFDIDDNGYFRGQFEYYENEITLGEVGGRPATERPVHESVSFFYGKLRFRWNYRIFKNRNPLLWKSNRLYKGDLRIVHRFDSLNVSEEATLECIYTIIHHRESRVVEFVEKKVFKESFQRPKQFTLFKELQTMLDPYTNVKRIFEDRFRR